MAVNTWNLWEWLGWKPHEIFADVDTDVDAIVTYLQDVHYDVDELLKLFTQLQKLRDEAGVLTDERAVKENLRRQIELYDRLFLRYEYYDQDADINGIRVKNIAKQYLDDASRHKLYELSEKMKKESRWYFDW